jgi:AraC-like DNA-binding protein
MENKFVITEINRVIMVGKDEYTEKESSFSPNLRHNELIFHFSGHLDVHFNNKEYEAKAGTVRFLPKGRWEKYEVVRRESGECIDVFFESDLPVSSEAFEINVSQNEKIGGLFQKLFSVWVSKTDGYYFEALSLLYRIFAELQKNSFTPKRHAEKIAPALEIIHNDFLTADFSLCALAALCNMGESYFQRLFKEKYGVSPKKYIIRLKINHACDLLRLGRYSVTQIAEMCNFSDVYFFSRQFKEYMGITPTAFVKKYKSSK